MLSTEAEIASKAAGEFGIKEVAVFTAEVATSSISISRAMSADVRPALAESSIPLLYPEFSQASMARFRGHLGVTKCFA